MNNTLVRTLACGFIAGAIAFVTFHQGGFWLAKQVGLSAGTQWSLAATKADNRKGMTPEFAVATALKLDEDAVSPWRRVGFTAQKVYILLSHKEVGVVDWIRAVRGIVVDDRDRCG